MKKAVAITLGLVVVIISAILVIGFIQKNQTNNTSSNIDQSTTTTNASDQNSQTTAIPTLTVTEVAKHNTAADCWIIVDNKVYDVTNYLESHPGGADKIIANCGSDATAAFGGGGRGGKGHSSAATSALNQYLLGSL